MEGFKCFNGDKVRYQQMTENANNLNRFKKETINIRKENYNLKLLIVT